MLPNLNLLARIAFGMVGLWILLFYPVASFSQDENAEQRLLQVGVMTASPLSMKTVDGRWEGFSVELWQAVAQRLKVPFEFREFERLEDVLDALARKEIDVFPSLPVGEQYAATIDFSQSYLKSGLSIAVPIEGVDYRWLRVFEGIFSKHVLKAIVLLVLLSMIAGIMVWLFERRKNNEMFGDGILGGIGHGIWWAMVTMTTVGYGDKAPKTAGGRIVALVWMIFSIIFIASVTANITTSMTISELRGKVHGFNDLYKARVGAVSRSEGFDFLTKQGISVMPFEGIQEGMAAVAGQNLDAFVLNEQLLKYLVKKEFPGRVQILPGTYDDYFVSIALAQNSPLRKPINKALLHLMKTANWTELQNRYIK